MAIVSGSNTTYAGAGGAAAGNREDLEDVIWNLFAQETYCLSNLDHVEASGVFHEWLKDTLAGAGANIQLEGDASSFATAVIPTRVGNYNQISSKSFLVSRTQEIVAKAGRTSELKRLGMKKMLELKNDMELALVGNQGSASGDAATARSSAGMESWISTNIIKATSTSGYLSTGYDAGIVASATTNGSTTGALTEAAFTAALEDAWSAGGMTTIVLTNAAQKAVINGFAGVVTKNIDMSVGSPKQATIIGASDMYVSSFGNHQIVLHRHVRTSIVMAIDPSYWAVAFLDRPFVEPRAKVQDGQSRYMAAEFCLVARNEKANAKVVGCS